jgi:hypothetical protein
MTSSYAVLMHCLFPNYTRLAAEFGPMERVTVHRTDAWRRWIMPISEDVMLVSSDLRGNAEA